MGRIAIFLILFLSFSSLALVLKLPESAVKDAFPEATNIEIKNIVLTEEQIKKAESIYKKRIDDRLVSFYVGKKGEEILGYAVIDTHIVRTKPETFMVVIGPNGEVRSIEIIAFYEPMEYMPTEKWLNLFNGINLNSGLRVKRDIPNITGATLSAIAITEGVRKILAIHKVLFGNSPYSPPP